MRDNVHTQAVTPCLELLDGGGPKGVGGAQHHLLPIQAVHMGELGDAGCLSHTVYADHQQDQEAAVSFEGPGSGVNSQDADHLLFQHLQSVVRACDPLLLYSCLYALQ